MDGNDNDDYDNPEPKTANKAAFDDDYTFEDENPVRDDQMIREKLQKLLDKKPRYKQAILLIESDTTYEVLVSGRHADLEEMIANVVEQYDDSLKTKATEDQRKHNPGLHHLWTVALQLVSARRVFGGTMDAQDVLSAIFSAGNKNRKVM